MKTVCKLDKCTGCMACVEICSKSAITISDNLSSYNAVIDEKKCVDCGQCLRVCQQNFDVKKNKPILWQQGWANKDNIRETSSSGGLASAIIESFIKNNGLVCSCVFENGEFIFKIIEDINLVNIFQGSKYVKSNPGGIYLSIKKKLVNGDKILFVGLPCQVAGLKKFVGEKLLDNLYTIDLICHGSPSPKLLKIYLEGRNINIYKIENLKFRVKTNFNLHNNYKSLTLPGVYDRYTISFLKKVNYTENCYSCNYASVDRISDLTLGDSWGTNLPKEEQDKGISLILCQTEKGKEMLNMSDLYLTDVDIKNAISNNNQLYQPATIPDTRKKFFKMIKNGVKYDRTLFYCYPLIFLRQDIKWLLIKLKLLRGGALNYSLFYFSRKY